MRGAISIADAVWALRAFGVERDCAAAVQVDRATLGRALRMLSFDLADSGAPNVTAAAADGAVYHYDSTSPSGSRSLVSVERARYEGQFYNVGFVQDVSARVKLPRWFHEVDSLPLEESGVIIGEPPIEPLFTPSWQRMILVSALGGRMASLEIIVEAIIERIARKEVIADLPRATRRSLYAGAQILVDSSDSMRPFVEDQARIIDAVAKLLPRERLEVVLCRNGPPRTGCAGADLIYELPAASATVLILGNFGIATNLDAATGGDMRAWEAFVQRVRLRGCPVVCFAPMDVRRLPKRSRQALSVVPWDRRTGTGRVNRARSRALGTVRR